MRILTCILTAAVLALVGAPAFSQSIFVWDKDHNLKFTDPEGAGQVDATYGVSKALTDNGFTHTTGTSLPFDLSSYDIIFVVMGTYC